MLSGSLSLDDPFTMSLVVIATILVIGYLIGRAVNKRRAQTISDWLEPGLRSLGSAPVVQAVNRTAFRVKVTQARNPFAVVTATVVLISRESLPTWLWELLHRRQDLLVFHLTLKRSPAIEVEIVDPATEMGRRGEAQARDHSWASADADAAYRVYHSPSTLSSEARTLATGLAGERFVPARVAVRRNAPHVLVNMPMPNTREVASADLARWLTRLSRQVRTDAGGESG